MAGECTSTGKIVRCGCSGPPWNPREDGLHAGPRRGCHAAAAFGRGAGADQGQGLAALGGTGAGRNLGVAFGAFIIG
jgi:hypothetical protein